MNLQFRFMTLLPGDVILTGTPAGVGFSRKPPEFLKVINYSKLILKIEQFIINN